MAESLRSVIEEKTLFIGSSSFVRSGLKSLKFAGDISEYSFNGNFFEPKGFNYSRELLDLPDLVQKEGDELQHLTLMERIVVGDLVGRLLADELLREYRVFHADYREAARIFLKSLPTETERTNLEDFRSPLRN